MYLVERELEVAAPHARGGLLDHLARAVLNALGPDETPVRFVVSESDEGRYRCEIGVMAGGGHDSGATIFRLERRAVEDTSRFNAALVVPTGIGAEIGGHAGDATPVAGLLASACDTLITHPNVVNASDVIDLPRNALYVEGSVLSRLLMGTVGLQPVRSNRVLVVIDAHPDTLFTHAAVNAVSAARASYGLSGGEVVEVTPRVVMDSRFTSTGRATGRVDGLDGLLRTLDERRGSYDAVALSSVIDVPLSYHTEYFERAGEMVNPWGGVEALLTHSLSTLYDVPTAHSPMMESREIANADPGIVDPRMAAEAVSLTFLQCILKGLQRSPRIVTGPGAAHHSVLTASDVSCLVIPDGCVGLPTLAALEQGIPVIAVRENRNLMRNDLRSLPWAEGQLYVVENYWEAAGVMSALRAGIDPEAVRRPIPRTRVGRSAEPVEALADRLLPF